MLKRPWPSVTAVRTFSIRTGLAASTVTPGSTAPELSRTTPAMPLVCCARAGAGAATRSVHAKTATYRAPTVLCAIDLSLCRLLFRVFLRVASDFQNVLQGVVPLVAGVLV